MITDSTYSALAQKTPSEAVAKEMLRDVLLGTDSKGKAIIITTFSSHIARLKSIISLSKKLGRKIVFLGRSLTKYVGAAENINLVDFSKDVELVKYSRQISKKIREIMKKPEEYIVVVTGHQGEPKSVLTKMVSGELPFKFNKGDHVIFSCKTIPSEVNIRNREKLENELKKRNLRIFKDIHVSGHAAREDLRDLIQMTDPDHIIPAHGDITMTSSMASLASELGYSEDKIHLMQDGQKVVLENQK